MKILVGIDLSESVDLVVQKADELARLLTAQVWLVHISEPEPDFVGFHAGSESIKKTISDAFHHEHQQLQEIADALRKGGINATSLLVQGATVEKLLQQASKLEVDMIVVGSHQRGSISRFLVGSVSSGLIQGAKCPVLVVPTLLVPR
jgi:nucleotide-binding universal stress UspA family protein